MRYLLIALAIGAALTLTATASGGGRSPAQLQRAGWDCLNPAAAFPENPNVHCFPPGKLGAVVAGTAVSALLVTFATPDVNAEEAPFLGTEHMLRADHFHNQPCPTDPPGGPPGESRSPPLYEWSYLGPRFGWDYYICHHSTAPGDPGQNAKNPPLPARFERADPRFDELPELASYCRACAERKFGSNRCV